MVTRPALLTKLREIGHGKVDVLSVRLTEYEFNIKLFSSWATGMTEVEGSAE